MHTESATRTFRPGNLISYAGRPGTVDAVDHAAGTVAIDVATGTPAHKARSIDDLFEQLVVPAGAVSHREVR